ncbi:helix-turn-helix domain-containing protein [Pusillimonas sp. TS35]|nr:helix-turn-helix domain-containing protein [Pusillimonas sp. TS35]
MDKTLAKGIAVLEFLVNRRQPCSVSDVAQAFGLVPSNAHRTLQTLVALGYARQTSDARYQPTLRLFELGSTVVGALDIRQIAHQALAGLAAATRETIHLVVRDEDHVVYLDKIDSPQPVAAYSHIGGRAPAHCVASGKAILAALLPQDDVQALAWLQAALPSMPAHTPNSHVHHVALLKDLREASERGYAINRGEWREDVYGLGAPVFDSQGKVAGALGISLPAIRATPELLPGLGVALCEAAQSTSRLLGHRPQAASPSTLSSFSFNEQAQQMMST